MTDQEKLQRIKLYCNIVINNSERGIKRGTTQKDWLEGRISMATDILKLIKKGKFDI